MITFHNIIPGNHNVHFTFENGLTVSISAGDGIYSTKANSDRGDAFSSVEVGAWNADGDWVKLDTNNDVIGWQNANSVLEIMNMVAAYKRK